VEAKREAGRLAVEGGKLGAVGPQDTVTHGVCGGGLRVGQRVARELVMVFVEQSDFDLAAAASRRTKCVTWAFLALAQHHLRQVAEAQSNLARLRETMQTPECASDPVLRDFLTEAEETIEPK
jgi:hypothetical protein